MEQRQDNSSKIKHEWHPKPDEDTPPSTYMARTAISGGSMAQTQCLPGKSEAKR